MSDQPPLFFERRLGRLLRYSPFTGALHWKARPANMFPDAASAARWNGRYAGTPALTAKNASGYLTGIVLGRHVKAHSVAFAIAHGRWPREIDHINGDKEDNRLVNLREVTRQENSKNRSMRSDNRTGIVGISARHGKWLTRIQADGRSICLGTFDKFEDAVAARKAAEARYGYHANHGRRA